MRHKELVQRIVKKLEAKGYDVSDAGWKWLGLMRGNLSGVELLKIIEENPLARDWVDLCTSWDEYRIRGRPDVIAVKRGEALLIECKAITERLTRQLSFMKEFAKIAAKRFRGKVRVILALDIDTEGIELWGFPE